MPSIKITSKGTEAKLTRAEVRAIETTRGVCQLLVKNYPPCMTPADAADEALTKLLIHFGEIEPDAADAKPEAQAAK